MIRTLLVLALLVSSSCASLPIKQRAVVSLQASVLALEGSHIAERKLCSPTAIPTQSITHCDGTLAMTIGLTDDRHLALARLYSRAFNVHDQASVALRAWRAGDPKPATLSDYQTAINELINLIVQFIPAAQPTAERAQAARTEVEIVVTAIGGRQ